jgi:hypothetical protein
MAQYAKPVKRLRLKAEFEAAGLRTVKEISEATKVKENTLHGILSGWRYPGSNVQGVFCETLGISIDRLRGLL